MSTPQHRPFTLEALQPPATRSAQWRRIPVVTRDALRMVWAASPRLAITATALQFVGAAVIGAQLLVGKRLLTELIAVSNDGRSAGSLLPSFLVLIAVTIVGGVVVAITANQQRQLGELVARYTFDRIIEVSAAVPLDAFETPAFHDQLARAKTSGSYRPMDMVNNITMLITAVLTSAGVLAVLFTIEPLLIPFVLLAAVPLLISTLYNSRQAYQFEYALTPQSRERMYLMDILTGRDSAKEIRVFGSIGFLSKRYDALSDERIAKLKDYLRQRLRVALTGTVASAIGTAVALGTLGAFLADGRIDVASAVTAGVALQLLSSRMSQVTSGLGRLVESGMFLDDFSTFIALGQALGHERRPKKPAGVVVRGSQREAREFQGLELDGVSFTYPGTDRPVLQDVDLRVEPGEVIALVGENGSGKTTLVKLITQLYQAHSGRVLWGGRDASEIPPDEIRADMTVLFQDYIQYFLSAGENIAMGRVERTPDQRTIEAAAVQGGAHDLISRLPQGYHTRLGRQFYGGHELSIGQWQRLALARAFFRGGGFLILDKPTTSLDPRAEHELFQQMRGLAEGRSVLMVSHRFSSVRTADRIYVMQHGRITEAGSHSELMARGGHYSELFSLQARAYLHEDTENPTSGALA
jgi:ATP-binding cassette, subfamily B, bacterial